jgi:hypothetical protein
LADGTNIVTGGSAVSTQNKGEGRRRPFSPWYLLYVVPLFAVLWVPFYNRIDPQWLGMPFFYWYQLLWVVISALFTAVIYFRVPE